MIYLVIAFILLLLYMIPSLRTIVFSPIKTVKYFFIDVFHYLIGRHWNVCPEGGDIICYQGLFGQGKTASAVRKVYRIFKKYNGKKFYNFKLKKWITTRVLVLSNVELTFPYTYMQSLAEFVTLSKCLKDIDLQNDTSTTVLILIDEASVNFCSRNFKTNLNSLTLNAILTCRHVGMDGGNGKGGGASLFLTAQRFQHVDALLRSVTKKVVNCSKHWRVFTNEIFDAFDLENATNISLIRSEYAFAWFATSKEYSLYDTRQVVEELHKSISNNDLLSNEEITNLIFANDSIPETVIKPKKKLRKRLHG